MASGEVPEVDEDVDLKTLSLLGLVNEQTSLENRMALVRQEIVAKASAFLEGVKMVVPAASITLDLDNPIVVSTTGIVTINFRIIGKMSEADESTLKGRGYNFAYDTPSLQNDGWPRGYFYQFAEDFDKFLPSS